MSADKGLTLEAGGVTPVVRCSGVEVGAHHNGFCDSLVMDIARA